MLLLLLLRPILRRLFDGWVVERGVENVREILGVAAIHSVSRRRGRNGRSSLSLLLWWWLLLLRLLGIGISKAGTRRVRPRAEARYRLLLRCARARGRAGTVESIEWGHKVEEAFTVGDGALEGLLLARWARWDRRRRKIPRLILVITRRLLWLLLLLRGAAAKISQNI